ncbi:tyrosine-protein phosphatase non-receptor type 9-like isoform X2 [Paramacrobiotus metropolitanus]|nr:tyrosine-protein phosphatase non-receptor type 9-like isoform X2 [Paramacrobiotus metropolitanus]XP_055346156.1 tyrosine-protein phosphatase non-receptor type 9-like isoform X2 [Paramacrobiotus metropolitanus]
MQQLARERDASNQQQPQHSEIPHVHHHPSLAINNLISKPHPHVGVISKAMALKFLMARKFDVARALELYRQYQIVRHTVGLNGLDPHSEPLRSELYSGRFTVLDAKDLQGATIGVLTARLHNPETKPATEKERTVTMQAVLFQLDAALASRETQRNGLTLVYDMMGVRWLTADLRFAKHLLSILKGGFPARLKKILIVDPPSWLSIPLSVIRPFITPKMLERIYLINRVQLREHIAPHSIPESLGGTLRHDHAHWIGLCVKRNVNELSTGDPRIPPLNLDGGVDVEGRYPFRDNGHSDQSRGNVGSVVNGGGLEESKVAMSSSVHRRSDKGMGVAQFVQLIRSMGKEGILREYDTLRAAARALPDKEFISFRLTENRAKNRYVDVPCFEATRVKLVHVPGGEDYIHANFVDGYEEKNAFISTQGPMPKTFGDFWLMVWEQECRVLVMTTRTVERGKQKCGQYWPVQPGESMEMGEFHVVNDGVKQLAYHVETTLLLKHNKSRDSRQVVHLQFTDWPDYGVPSSASSMFEFIQVMRSKQEEAVWRMKPAWPGPGSGPPILVHCSAGIGRSGSLMCVDICLRRLDDCGLVDLHQTVQKLRGQRCQSIQMPEQYLFCYLALVEYAVDRGLISRETADLDSLLPWLHDEAD